MRMLESFFAAHADMRLCHSAVDLHANWSSGSIYFRVQVRPPLNEAHSVFALLARRDKNAQPKTAGKGS